MTARPNLLTAALAGTCPFGQVTTPTASSPRSRASGSTCLFGHVGAARACPFGHLRGHIPAEVAP